MTNEVRRIYLERQRFHRAKARVRLRRLIRRQLSASGRPPIDLNGRDLPDLSRIFLNLRQPRLKARPFWS